MSGFHKLSLRQRILILAGLLLAGLIGLLFIEPIAQDPGYHLFADTRRLFGIPNFNDVVSNVGFAMVGILGMIVVLGENRHKIFTISADARPYVIFFIGVALVSLGSAYYHWEPSNERLLWDRLPMSITFMALTSAVIADRIDTSAGNGWLLLVLVLFGILSLIYWNYTEQLERGDLRFYAFVQFYSVIMLPFILYLFPDYHCVSGHYIVWILFWYGLSKILEYWDAEVFEILNYVISGHTLKHLAAAASAFVILRMLLSHQKNQT